MKALRYWYDQILRDEKARGILPAERELLDKLK